MHQVFCYKMRQLLQNAPFITNCDSTNDEDNVDQLMNDSNTEFLAGAYFDFVIQNLGAAINTMTLFPEDNIQVISNYQSHFINKDVNRSDENEDAETLNDKFCDNRQEKNTIK